MAETNRISAPGLSQPPPPPAPPLPPQRPSVLQRFIAPLAFSRPQRQQGTPVVQSSSASPKDGSQDRPVRRLPARNAVHRTSISISAIDINDQRTHAILAGRDILKTVRVQDRAVVEDKNLRNTVNTYISTQQLKPDDVRKRREFLPAKDVRWSHGKYSHVIATAAQNGRIALYDVSTLGSSRVELAWLYNHIGQVNKLDFDPHQGYMLLSGSQDKNCKIWDIRDPRNPLPFNSYSVKAPIRDVRWSPENVFDFAICTEGGVVQRWDVRNPNHHVLSINAHAKSCYTIAWHPDGKHLASGGLDKLLRFWDMNSESKGQKHLLQLRCPQGIMNLAWRPPSWSAEFARRGSWQTCHISTSYTDDDPRVHVWDLRRPLLPFRESSHFETRPHDMLWADKDLLWTAGGQGIFAQHDMAYAHRVEDSLPPGDIEWCPDGSFYAVVENRLPERRSSLTDPSGLFLNVPQDQLSGAEDGGTSQSWTDDEGADGIEHSRRTGKATARTSKSHPNTPPANDPSNKTLPLDQTIARGKELFVNGQVGAVSRIPDVFIPNYVVEFVAVNYARPSTGQERATDPSQILPKLKNAFLHNAKVCQAAGLRETARNWTLMAEVVVPELVNWANYNRKQRLLEDEKLKLNVDEDLKTAAHNSSGPFSKTALLGKDAKSPTRSEKVVSHLFRGVVDQHRGSSDTGSHGGSNLTTPRQQPFSSPMTTSKKDGSIWFTLDDAIEPIQPLPPSVANSHSTAAAASRNLLLDAQDLPDSPMSSPERPRMTSQQGTRHRRSATESVTLDANIATDRERSSTLLATLQTGQAQKPLVGRTQEDRRAALRDYRAATRQPFSLEASVVSPQYEREVRHDSSESFPMFSASGGSSARARSLAQSFGDGRTPNSLSRSRQDSSEWFEEEYEFIRENEPGDRDTPSDETRESSAAQTNDPRVDQSPSLPFSLDGASESRPAVFAENVTQKFKEVLAKSPKDKTFSEELRPQIEREVSEALTIAKTVVRARSIAALDSTREYHLSNPMIQETAVVEQVGKISKGDASLDSRYQISDFKPIDITRYEPWSPGFQASAYAVICEVVQWDINGGHACSQFSAHLLSHVHPFFFHQSCRSQPSSDDLANGSSHFADRLMNPAFSSRIVENIFATHIAYLRSIDLYIPAAEFRKICAEEFDYPYLAGPEARTPAGEVGDRLKVDPMKLRVSCSNCKSILAEDATICKSCKQSVEDCPICEQPLISPTEDATERTVDFAFPSNTKSAVSVYCHVCGHSAHLSCMTCWLTTYDVNGECPTPACGCDCGAGLLRDQRIARQIQANQESAAGPRASMATSTIKRDSKVVGQIPAVDKARNTLRKKSSIGFSPSSSSAERGTSRDREQRNTPGSAGTGNGVGAGAGSNTSTSAWSRKGTSAGGAGSSSSRMNAPSLGRSNSGGTSAPSAGGNAVSVSAASLGRRVRVVEPEGR